MNKKRYRLLPNVWAIEGMMLIIEICRVGHFGVKAPKITDEIYNGMVKLAVEDNKNED